MLGLFDMGLGCVPPMVRCECWERLSDMVLGCVPPMVRCKCWVGLSNMVHSMVRKRVGSVELPVMSRVEIAPVMIQK